MVDYGHRIDKSIALAMINPELNKLGHELEIDILGNNYPCEVLNESPYDPENEKIRA